MRSSLTFASVALLATLAACGTDPATGDDGCGFGGSGATGVGQWIYAAHNEDADLQLPSDDGAGKPVGMDVTPGQIGFFQMHYLNTSDADITVHVTLNAEAYDAGVQATKTFA